jgi:hypothetical protein
MCRWMRCSMTMVWFGRRRGLPKIVKTANLKP